MPRERRSTARSVPWKLPNPGLADDNVIRADVHERVQRGERRAVVDDPASDRRVSDKDVLHVHNHQRGAAGIDSKRNHVFLLQGFVLRACGPGAGVRCSQAMVTAARMASAARAIRARPVKLAGLVKVSPPVRAPAPWTAAAASRPMPQMAVRSVRVRCGAGLLGGR